MTVETAIKLLVKCEEELRSLVAVAAEAGDYDTVMRVTAWAKHLATLSASTKATTILEVGRSGAGEKRGSARSVASTYPRFGRRGEQLVKVGWSKSEKREYEHKAPRVVMTALMHAVIESGKNGRVFQVGQLLPGLERTDGSEIPDYQVYVVVAWWRSIGLLDQHGRQGYSITQPKDLAATVEYAWQSLAEI